MTIVATGQLRYLIEEDLPLILQWRNHEDIRRYMYSQELISWDNHYRWFKRCNEDPKKHLLLFLKDNKPQGFVSFTELSWGKIADWGFYLAPNSPKKTGSTLGRTAILFAKEQLALHKLSGQVIEFNKRSIIFHQRLGFIQEGLLTDHYFDGTQFHAVICFGLFLNQITIS